MDRIFSEYMQEWNKCATASKDEFLIVDVSRAHDKVPVGPDLDTFSNFFPVLLRVKCGGKVSDKNVQSRNSEYFVLFFCFCNTI